MQYNNYFYGPVYYYPQEPLLTGTTSHLPNLQANQWVVGPSTPVLSTRHDINQIVKDLKPHILTSQQMWAMGYPLEMEPNSGKAAFYINAPRGPVTFMQLKANSTEFGPGSANNSKDADTVERTCMRCSAKFRVSRNGIYMTNEMCWYHWGRKDHNSCFTCCQLQFGTKGCSTGKYHVWNGTVPGLNGPLDGYVRTVIPRGGVFAIDADMCFTTAGLELAGIVVIDTVGKIVYQSLVKPGSPLLDCNTRFSGMRPSDLARATKTLKDVQNDLLKFIGVDTILIGHALENDLRALKLIHGAVVDTSAMYPHPRGIPMRRSLKALAEEYLGRNIHQNGIVHSKLETAQTALDLVFQKLNEEKKMQTALVPLPLQSQAN